MMRRSHRYALCSIFAAAACASAPRAHEVPPSRLDGVPLERGGSSDAEPGSDERGIYVETTPLTLQIALHLQCSKDGPLGDGDTVVNGDRIQVSIQTSEDAHVYLAHCTANRDLTVFPEHGSIQTRAGEVTIAPGKESHLVLDNNPGPEALYVILSRTEISSADPRLAEAIQASQPGGATADCRDGLVSRATASTAAEASPGPSSHGGATRDRAQPTRPGRTAAHASGAAASTPADRPNRGIAVPPDDGPRPLVTIERGMYVSQNGVTAVTASADAYGIAVLRYRFQHVAAPGRSSPGGAPGRRS